jgi:hypothetical protein
MALPWDTKEPATNVKPVDTTGGKDDKSIDEEINRVKQTAGIPDSVTGGSTEFKQPDSPVQFGAKHGYSAKYIDTQGKEKVYSGGKGKKPIAVKKYLEGDLSAVTVIPYQPSKTATTIGKPKEGELDDSGLPVKGTQAYIERMNASSQLCAQAICGFLAPKYLERNNKMSVSEIKAGVFFCTPMVFKYYGYIEDQCEIVAVGWLVKNHLDHRKYIHPETNKIVTEEEFMQYVKSTDWTPPEYSDNEIEQLQKAFNPKDK